MPFSDQECRALLDYLRSRVGDAGFGAYDEQALGAALVSEQPGQQILRYLNEVVQLTGAASGVRRQDALREIQSWVVTRDGSEVTDIRVELSDAQAGFHDVRVIALPDDPRLQQLTRELAAIRDDLAKEIEPPTQNRGPRTR